MASDESEEEFYDAEEDSFILGGSETSESLVSVGLDKDELEKDKEVVPAKTSADIDDIVETCKADNTVVVVEKEPLKEFIDEKKTCLSQEDVSATHNGDLPKTHEVVPSDTSELVENHVVSLEKPQETDSHPMLTTKDLPKDLGVECDNSLNSATKDNPPNVDITSLKTQTSESSLNSDQYLINSVSQTDENGPPPIPPPRRKRKKKLEALAAAAQAQTDPKTGSAESLSSGAVTGSVTDDKSSKHTGPQASDIPVQVITKEDPVDNELDICEDSLKTVLEEPEPPTDEDIVIKLDCNTLEMHNVLDRAKTSSTQVVSENAFEMMRTKSASVNSLGGTGSSKSGSFVSVDSDVHNEGNVIYKSGSHHSLGSVEIATAKSSPSSLYRTSSFSGRPLSDTEILEQVIVTNLDTGESVPLSLAEETLPQCTNPLSLQIMRLTSEYSSNPDVAQLSDAEDHVDGGEAKAKTIKKKTKKLKSFIGKTVHKIKQKAEEERQRKAQKAEDSGSSDDESTPGTPYIKIKSSHKGPVEFERLRLVQELNDQHVGAVWTMKFSCCGRLLATAGQDNLVRVWVLQTAYKHFEELRNRYSKADGERPSSPTISEDSVEAVSTESEPKDVDENGGAQGGAASEIEDTGPFCEEPFCTYEGHTGDVLDLSWSKNYFLLSSSMDKTVRLWHISRRECLCCFQHIDFVTAITFHPRDDRYFLSGSLDGKIRLWNIPDKKVALWNEVEGSGSNLITAANFCINGKFAVVGTYDGRCIFYVTESLKYHTQIHVRSSRKKHAKGRKISGIEAMPGEDKVLITSNDSRIRLYDLKDHSLYCKYKGYTNTSSQIKGTFSPSGQYIICGSEDRYVYIWRTHHGVQSARRDRNDFYESFSAHDAVVTTAIFAPIPSTIVPDGVESSGEDYEVIVTADWTGKIKLFVNR